MAIMDIDTRLDLVRPALTEARAAFEEVTAESLFYTAIDEIRNDGRAERSGRPLLDALSIKATLRTGRPAPALGRVVDPVWALLYGGLDEVTAWVNGLDETLWGHTAPFIPGPLAKTFIGGLIDDKTRTGGELSALADHVHEHGMGIAAFVNMATLIPIVPAGDRGELRRILMASAPGVVTVGKVLRKLTPLEEAAGLFRDAMIDLFDVIRLDAIRRVDSMLGYDSSIMDDLRVAWDVLATDVAATADAFYALQYLEAGYDLDSVDALRGAAASYEPGSPQRRIIDGAIRHMETMRKH